ncbi:MAG TPA: hypothetical protein VH593_17330, partial [Ktedonobacteraceae bacterium]
MTALLKVYTDSLHTIEATHAPNIMTVISSSTTISSGLTQLAVVSTAGMAPSGFIDLDTGSSLETLAYSSVSGNTLNLLSATTQSHTGFAVVSQWYYLLGLGDQVNGFINDGTYATPIAGNTATWYLVNVGDQTAQNISLATSNVTPSTADGVSGTLISIT